MLLAWVVARAGNAEFHPAIAHVELDHDRVTPGSTLRATYVFNVTGASASDLQVFVHVVRPAGGHIGADFKPNRPTFRWPASGSVSEGPFAITLPTDAVPGRYQIWLGLFDPDSGERIPLENADLEKGNREYQVAHFEVIPTPDASPVHPAVFAWQTVSPVTDSPNSPVSEKDAWERIELTVDHRFLNPVQNPASHARLRLFGIHSNGRRQRLRMEDAEWSIKTIQASGPVEVVSRDGDQLWPREGGIARVEATLRKGGRSWRAATDIVVSPFYRDYHQTLVMKLFLGMEGKPVERLAGEALFQKPHEVLCTFEQALDVIRRTDHLTAGMPKILYLVGWQKGGHDHGYPSWDEVNPRLKREQDPDGWASLRWLIREARRYHTTVSLHINMVDAYRQSPLWDEYIARDAIARDEQGRPRVAGIQMQGEEMYHVVYPREWEAGLAQRRIQRLINRVPELRDGHTIHVDVFIALTEGKVISPWHAKPENGGLMPEHYVETQRKIFQYWRTQGFDVTGEGIFWAHPPGEGFTGLQAMSWWYPGDTGYPMRIPERLMARGRTDRGGDGDFRFGSSMHGEEIFQKDLQTLPGFLGMFCRTTLPWQWLSAHERLRLEGQTLQYSEGITAGMESGHRIIRQGSLVVRDNDDLFVPTLWNPNQIIAYSRTGYRDRAWTLPSTWREVRHIDVCRITQEGLTPIRQRVPVTGGKLSLSIAAEECIALLALPNRATLHHHPTPR